MKVVKKTLTPNQIVEDEIIATDKDWVCIILSDGTEIDISESKKYHMENKPVLNIKTDGIMKILPRATNAIWILEDK